jgi:glycosyltransferase involved in cell wall biosynthesis
VKILCFADTRFPIERANGVQTMATCHALAARGHQVTLVVRPDTASPARDPFKFYGVPHLRELSIEAVEKPKRTPGVLFVRAQFLLAALRRLSASDADVVFTRDLGLAAFLLQVPSVRRRPLVYEAHGASSIVAEEMPRLLGKPELAPSPRKIHRLDRRDARVWRNASAYVTITRALADELAARYGPRERVFVVPDGAPHPAVPVVPVVPVVAYAGHLYPWKGVDIFLRALALAPGVRGLIVGGHPAESDFGRVESLVRELGLTGRVELTGFVPPTDVRDRLTRASMLVLPNTRSAISERYTSPLKLFEYLALGRPIVASDLASIREVLTHEQTGLLVPPDDPRALAGAFERLAADAALSMRLARAAAALAHEYTWDRRAERLEAAFRASVAPGA